MTIDRRRMLALALVLSLFLSLLPSAAFRTSALAEDPLGIVTSSSVHVRKQASTSADYWFDLPQNFVCTILGETDAGGVHWFKVRTHHPNNPSSKNTYDGFIHGNFFRALTEEETASYNANGIINTASSTVTAAPASAAPTAASGTSAPASAGTVGIVTNGGTNFREGPSTKARSMMKLDRNTRVEILTAPSVISSETFYEVRYANLTGYIMSTFIRVEGSSVPTATPTPTPASGTSDATPTPAPTGSAAYTHVRLILSSCHLRETPGGTYDSDKDWEGRGKTLPLAGSPVSQGNYIWYPVRVNGLIRYVRNDCVQPFTEGDTTPTAVPTATPAAGVLGYVKTTKGGCNLRASIAGTVIKQIPRNRTLPYLLPPVKSNGYTWYFVEADGNRGYLRSDVVKVVNNNTPTPAPTAVPTAAPTGSSDATPTPTGSDGITGYVKTTAGGLNLREKAGYTAVLGRLDKDLILPYYGEPTVDDGISWYYVYTNEYKYGYLHGSFLALVDSDGTALPTATPVVIDDGSSSYAKQEASYTTLRLGSTGASVKNLVQELKNQGYFSGTVTTRYTSAVERAVEAFQKAKNLSVDGVAGSATQHALYGTVPIGSSDVSNLTITLYPAEKIDWYTGGINELWPRGANFKVYDVKTGIVWWAHRWAGGLHVDAEPLTASDTARLCKIYGVSNAQEIADKDLYQRRPMLVTIGTRTFACSLYGEPHNEGGNTIKDNNFPGQLCIHFTNSKIHGSKKVDSGHQEAIQYAWEHSPSGHK